MIWEHFQVCSHFWAKLSSSLYISNVQLRWRSAGREEGGKSLSLSPPSSPPVFEYIWIPSSPFVCMSWSAVHLSLDYFWVLVCLLRPHLLSMTGPQDTCSSMWNEASRKAPCCPFCGRLLSLLYLPFPSVFHNSLVCSLSHVPFFKRWEELFTADF